MSGVWTFRSELFLVSPPHIMIVSDWGRKRNNKKKFQLSLIWSVWRWFVDHLLFLPGPSRGPQPSGWEPLIWSRCYVFSSTMQIREIFQQKFLQSSSSWTRSIHDSAGSGSGLGWCCDSVLSSQIVCLSSTSTPAQNNFYLSVWD